MHIDYISIMKQLSNFIFFLFLIIVLSSCGRDFYVPNPSNLLVLESKKDFKSSVGINSAQVAYSPIEKLGLKADFGYVRSRNSFGERNLNIGTIGLGYYNSKQIKPLFSGMEKSIRRPQAPSIGFDIFANMSLGRINTNNNDAFDIFRFPMTGNLANNFQANVYKPNLSGQVYWKSKIFTLNLGVRYSYLNFFNGIAFGEFDPMELDRASRLIDLSPKSNIEYDLKVSYGNNHISSFLSLSWNQTNLIFDTINSSFAFGIDVNISSFHADTLAKEKSEKKVKAKKKKPQKKKRKK